MRTITLTAMNKTVSMAAYVKAVKMAIANPDVEFKYGLTCWWPCTGAEVRQQFYEGIQDRINQAVPYSQRGAAQC